MIVLRCQLQEVKTNATGNMCQKMNALVLGNHEITLCTKESMLPLASPSPS